MDWETPARPFAGRSLWVAIAAAVTLLFAPFAWAQSAESDAREEFWAGNEAYLAGDYPAAVAHFEAAYRLAPNARVQAYLGRVYIAMDRYPEALEAFERAASDDPTLAEELEATIAGVRTDMSVRALGGARQAVGAAWRRARGDQPLPQNQRRMELGTIMSDVPVQIQSRPSGASVFIDGTEFGAFGVTPLDTPLFTGTHIIEVQLPHHEPVRRVVNIVVPRRGDPIPVFTFDLERLSVDAVVNVSPATARATFVAADGGRVDLGTGGYEGPLPAGPGTFIVQHGGRDQRVEAVVEPGEDGTFTQELSLLSAGSGLTGISIEIGTIIIVSQVEDGEVSVDGRTIGTGEGEFRADLTPGEHTVRISRDGYTPFEQTVSVTPDSEATLYVNDLERARRRR